MRENPRCCCCCCYCNYCYKRNSWWWHDDERFILSVFLILFFLSFALSDVICLNSKNFVLHSMMETNIYALEIKSEKESCSQRNACLWQAKKKTREWFFVLIFNFCVIVMIYSVHTSTNKRYVCVKWFIYWMESDREC